MYCARRGRIFNPNSTRPEGSPRGIFEVIELGPDIVDHLPKGSTNPGIIFDADDTLAPHDSPKLFDRVLEMLVTLESSGIPFVVVSNNRDRELARQRAEALGITEERYIIPEGILDMKPSPRMVRRAINTLGGKTCDVLAVGDGMTDTIAYRLAGVAMENIRTLHGIHEPLGYPGRAKVRRAWYWLLGLNTMTDPS